MRMRAGGRPHRQADRAAGRRWPPRPVRLRPSAPATAVRKPGRSGQRADQPRRDRGWNAAVRSRTGQVAGRLGWFAIAIGNAARRGEDNWGDGHARRAGPRRDSHASHSFRAPNPQTARPDGGHVQDGLPASARKAHRQTMAMRPALPWTSAATAGCLSFWTAPSHESLDAQPAKGDNAVAIVSKNRIGCR